MESFLAGDYEALLCALLERGYRAVPIDRVQPDRPDLFLRHDVDLCPERALSVAEREARLGLSATYYFLVSTDLYSIASARNRSILRKVAAMGHEIGLHFDVTAYDHPGDEMESFANAECEFLEAIIEGPVRSVSFHQPAKELLNRSGAFAGRRHAYEPDFFSRIAYVSDSNGGWHHGHPLDHPNVLDRKALQLLTHPIWWCNLERLTAYETMERLHLERSKALSAGLKATVRAYREGDALQEARIS